MTPSSATSEHDKLSANSSKQESVPKEKSILPKPIMAHGIGPKDLRGFIKICEEAGDVNFTVQALPEQYIKIFPATASDKNKICQHLEKKNVPFYIIPDSPRLLKVVIGELDLEIDEIQDCLVRNGFPVLQISQMKSRRDGKPLPLFLITLIKSPEAEEIFNLKSILRIRIRVTLYRPPKKATQCYRCNLFHHVARNCKMTPRCGICSGSHESKDCIMKKIPIAERTDPKCCNCGKNHVASYKGCENYPKRPSYAQMTKRNTPKLVIKKQAQPQTFTKNFPSLKQTNEKNSLYEPYEMKGDAEELANLVKNLKKELEISSLVELKNWLLNALKTVQAQKTLTDKRLAFFDVLSSDTKENNLDTTCFPTEHSP